MSSGKPFLCTFTFACMKYGNCSCCLFNVCQIKHYRGIFELAIIISYVLMLQHTIKSYAEYNNGRHFN